MTTPPPNAPKSQSFYYIPVKGSSPRPTPLPPQSVVPNAQLQLYTPGTSTSRSEWHRTTLEPTPTSTPTRVPAERPVVAMPCTPTPTGRVQRRQQQQPTPARPGSPMAIDSAFVQTAANALAPAIENALYAIAKRSQTDPEKTTMTSVERVEQAARQKEASDAARMKAEIESLVAENKKLVREAVECEKDRKKLQVIVAILTEEKEIVRDVLRATAGSATAVKSQAELVEIVRGQFREQFGQYVAKILAEAQDEKELRVGLEKKLDEALDQLQALQGIATRKVVVDLTNSPRSPAFPPHLPPLASVVSPRSQNQMGNLWIARERGRVQFGDENAARMMLDGDEGIEEEGRRVRQVMNSGGFPIPERSGPAVPLDKMLEGAFSSTERDPRTMMKRMVAARIGPIDLFYTIEDGKIICRACQSRQEREGSESGEIAQFSRDASWGELVWHYETKHPGACDYFEGMSARRMIEYRQWLVKCSLAMVLHNQCRSMQ